MSLTQKDIDYIQQTAQASLDEIIKLAQQYLASDWVEPNHLRPSDKIGYEVQTINRLLNSLMGSIRYGIPIKEHTHKIQGKPYDRQNKRIQVGDIIYYYSGTHRDIRQKYVAQSLTEGPNCFRSVGPDGKLQEASVPLFNLDEWSEIIGNIYETPLEESEQ
jgi:hypothetical protein